MSHLYPACKHRPNAKIDNVNPCSICGRTEVVIVTDDGTTGVYSCESASVDAGVVHLVGGVFERVIFRNGLRHDVFPPDPSEAADLFIWPKPGSTMRRVVR